MNLKNLVNWFDGMVFRVSIMLIIFGIVFLVDWKTGVEVSVAPLYAVVVLLGTLWYGLGIGVGVAFVAVAGGYWLDMVGGAQYSAVWIHWEHCAIRFMFLIAVCALVAVYRKYLVIARKRAEALAAEIPICSICGRLQDSSGCWLNTEDYIRLYTKAKVSKKICYLCKRRTDLNRNPKRSGGSDTRLVR